MGGLELTSPQNPYISFFFIAIFFYLLARAIWQDPEIRLALKQIYRNSKDHASKFISQQQQQHGGGGGGQQPLQPGQPPAG
ncbi:hypothetical protein KC353_g17105, partial [Hortaea werneckii]